MFRLFFVFIEKLFHLYDFRKTLSLVMERSGVRNLLQTTPSLVEFNYTNQTIGNDKTDSDRRSE